MFVNLFALVPRAHVRTESVFIQVRVRWCAGRCLRLRGSAGEEVCARMTVVSRSNDAADVAAGADPAAGDDSALHGLHSFPLRPLLTLLPLRTLSSTLSTCAAPSTVLPARVLVFPARRAVPAQVCHLRVYVCGGGREGESGSTR